MACNGGGLHNARWLRVLYYKTAPHSWHKIRWVMKENSCRINMRRVLFCYTAGCCCRATLEYALSSFSGRHCIKKYPASGRHSGVLHIFYCPRFMTLLLSGWYFCTFLCFSRTEIFHYTRARWEANDNLAACRLRNPRPVEGIFILCLHCKLWFRCVGLC